MAVFKMTEESVFTLCPCGEVIEEPFATIVIDREFIKVGDCDKCKRWLGVPVVGTRDVGEARREHHALIQTLAKRLIAADQFSDNPSARNIKEESTALAKEWVKGGVMEVPKIKMPKKEE